MKCLKILETERDILYNESETEFVYFSHFIVF
ncbi:hypothetical protein M972_111552 [Acetivibrio thermocellus AD2]|jgi:hypothetical protein|uniref:Uncharacterized protein n=1 Tax=Acetivibrio thermocellus AD2 TaxID=1138384 RepID=A0AB36TGX8_ACETH|nr:hypothetical protein AD2_01499 [Acetivibrio thermocellus AD2]ANV76241.1 hypothetical protein LQRI_1500 [Acetivibrio thermocellus DSM 2360]PFH02765.1 hypothetical protein M972_111552 [Acetivibrio thermocellus AD2]CDG35430.1 hypothetical protein CTHBC1_0770 [Acetivibrio thermocellus BC1]SOD25158.1 hypothetical protein SAMN04515622_2043 [Acetivibrio thermocellus]